MSGAPRNGPASEGGLTIAVECYAGYKGDETPRALVVGGRRLGVREVIDRWLAPDHAYFKVRCENDAVFIVRHDLDSLAWEVTLFEPPPTDR